jgi:tetratricopeptide (TPR) repeat protein
MGHYGEALEVYERAADAYRALGDETGWARTRIGAAVTWRYTGVALNGLAEIEQARAILLTRHLWVRLARLEQHAGILFSQLGQLDEAMACYQRALEATRRFDPPDESQEARILGNLALAHQQRGEYERAEALHDAAVAVFALHGQAHELAQARANSAQLLSDQGHYSRALELASSARRGFLQLGRRGDAAFAGRAGAHCLLALNRFHEAVSLATEVAAEFSGASADLETAGTLVLRSAGLRRLGNYQTALRDLDTAERVFQASSCRGWAAIVRAERAALLADTERWSEAADEASNAVTELLERGLVVDGAQTMLVRAAALRALGAATEARHTVNRALATIHGRAVPWLEYQAQRVAGELAQADGRALEALDAYGRAVTALEQVQGRILTEGRATYLADKVDIYEAVVGLYLDTADHERAFDYVERAKSRALVDALAGRLDIRIRPRNRDEQVLADQLLHLRRQHERLSARASGLLSPALEQLEPGQEPPAFPGDELAQCERQIAALLEELRSRNMADLERLALLQGKTFPLPLAASARLIEYFAVDADLCVFVVGPGECHALRLAGARTRVERLVARLALALESSALALGKPAILAATDRVVRSLLARLYQELVAPVAAWLCDAERLVFVPHGRLHHLPFAALHDGQRYLIERFEVVHGPSASALAFCRRPLATATGRALAVAHSNDGALPGAVAEAQLVAALFDAGECLLEEKATRDRIARQAATVDVLHLAAHGEARPDAPLFSFLRLADGRLTALDCFELELDCGLVTLSACESGQAVLAPGDEPIGLTRALLYAGARAVLHTLWRVDDQSTLRLMETFYRCLRAGRGRAEALRAAQLDLLQDREHEWRHPFFWAPLVLVGDWAPMWGEHTQ